MLAEYSKDRSLWHVALVGVNMGRRCSWDDLLAIFLVFLVFTSTAAIIPIVQMDPAFKRMRAREDCKTLAFAVKLLATLRAREAYRDKNGSEGDTWLLYTWNRRTSVTDNMGRWPNLSKTIRPWRCYKGNPNSLPKGFQSITEFLEDWHPDRVTDQNVLLKARRIGFDPWGRPYLINIGNMKEDVKPDPGFAFVTWVISAGPNGMIESSDRLPLELERKKISPMTYVPKDGDDIGYVVDETF